MPLRRLTLLAGLLALASPPSSAQGLLGNGEIAVVTEDGLWTLPSGTGVSAVRQADAAALGGLQSPAVEWRRDSDDFLVVSGSRLLSVTITDLAAPDSAIVTDLTPAFGVAGVVLVDLDIDPGFGHIWLLDTANALAYRCDEPFAPGMTPAVTLAVPAGSQSLAADSHRYPFSLLCGGPPGITRVRLDGSTTLVAPAPKAAGLDVKPEQLANPFACRPEQDVVGYAAGLMLFVDLNFTFGCLPIVYAPRDVEWDPVTCRVFVLAEGGVNPCQFPGLGGANVNHVVRLPQVIGPPQPKLVTKASGSGITGVDGDLAIAHAPFAFCESYGAACVLVSGDPLVLKQLLGPPTIPNPDFQLSLVGAPPGAGVALMFGLQAVSIPVQGCLLQVQWPGSPLIAFLGPTNAEGVLDIPLAIAPPVQMPSVLQDLALYAQAYVQDVNGANRVSNGLMMLFSE